MFLIFTALFSLRFRTLTVIQKFFTIDFVSVHSVCYCFLQHPASGSPDGFHMTYRSTRNACRTEWKGLVDHCLENTAVLRIPRIYATFPPFCLGDNTMTSLGV